MTILLSGLVALQRSSLSGRYFDTGSSTKTPHSARGSFEQSLSPFNRPDITQARQQSSRAMAGNFVMTSADVDRVVRDGQRSQRRSLDRSGRNSLDKSLRLSGRQSERGSERKKSRRLSFEQ